MDTSRTTSRARPRTSTRRTRRAGFTLIEMMVALTIGAMVIATVYTIGASAARHFQEQQRVSQLQLSVRLALDRIRRDVARAGFHGTMDSQTDPTCGPPPAVRIRGLSVTEPGPTADLAGMPGFVPGQGQSDVLDISGNFRTGDTYLVREWSGARLELQTMWQGYRRSFSADPSSNTIDVPLVQATFAPGTPLLVRGGGGARIWATSGGANANAVGTNATINTTLGFPADCSRVPGMEGWCQNGCTVAPVSVVRYEIVTAPPALQPRIPLATGPNTVLMRTEINPNGGAVIDGPTPVLEYAVHFDIDTFLDTAGVGGAPSLLQLQNDAAAVAATAARPDRIRGVRISIAARTPEHDTHLSELVAPLGDGTPRVFAVFPAPRAGAARVRSAYTEVFLPNMSQSE